MSKAKFLLWFHLWLLSLGALFFLGENLRQNSNDRERLAREITEAPTKSQNALKKSTLAASLLPAFNELSATDLDEALWRIRYLDLDQQVAFFQEALDLPFSDARRLKLLRALLNQMANSSPELAMQLLQENKSQFTKILPVQKDILRYWGQSDFTAAMEWHKTFYPSYFGIGKEVSLCAIFEGYSKTDPSAALEASFALDFMNEEITERIDWSERKWVIKSVITELLNRGEREATLERLLAIEESESFLRYSLLNYYLKEVASFYPQELLANYEIFENMPYFGNKWDLAKVWADTDPIGAAEFAKSNPESFGGAFFGQASTQIVDSWSDYDLAATGEWLNSVKDATSQESVKPTALDDAFAIYARKAAREDPSVAVDWVDLIQDESKRKGLREEIVETWRKTDPAGLEAYLTATDNSLSTR